MRISRFGYAVSISAAALLACCGGSQAIGVPVVQAQRLNRFQSALQSAQSEHKGAHCGDPGI